jgi:hypothetical protein
VIIDYPVRIHSYPRMGVTRRAGMGIRNDL